MVVLSCHSPTSRPPAEQECHPALSPLAQGLACSSTINSRLPAAAPNKAQIPAVCPATVTHLAAVFATSSAAVLAVILQSYGRMLGNSTGNSAACKTSMSFAFPVCKKRSLRSRISCLPQWQRVMVAKAWRRPGIERKYFRVYTCTNNEVESCDSEARCTVLCSGGSESGERSSCEDATIDERGEGAIKRSLLIIGQKEVDWMNRFNIFPGTRKCLSRLRLRNDRSGWMVFLHSELPALVCFLFFETVLALLSLLSSRRFPHSLCWWRFQWALS